MNIKAKALLIPVAAFAVTVTGASAFNSEVLEKAGLSNTQISAFEEAHELRKDGDREAAREVIVDAGIDQETLESVREAMKEHREETRTAIKEAVDNEDYNAFVDAADGSPLADIITSEDDFEQFVEAHELREAGDKEAAKEILEDLGFEGKMHMKGHGGNDEGRHGFQRGDRDVE